jgi:SagB-type dehydrogenase family enzyme
MKSNTKSGIKLNELLHFDTIKNNPVKNIPIPIFKRYPRFENFILPRPKLNKKISLVDVLLRRQSVRKYQSYKPSLLEMGTFLYYSVGVKSNIRSIPHRFYPSAGARYPIEIYIASFNTELTSGIYHYAFKSHSLEKLYECDWRMLSKYINQNEFHNVSFVVIMTGIYMRSFSKYNSQAYPMTMIEAGHICQNMYLIATSMNLAGCAVCGFKKDEINNLIDIDGVNETSLYMFAVGKEKK